MQKLISGTFVVALIFSSVPGFASLTFKEWKQKRVAEKAAVFAQIKSDKTIAESEKSNRIRQAEYNLQTEKELTPNDYFHLYLAERFRSNPEKARAVAEKLSSKELADIVTGYLELYNHVREPEANSNLLQTSR